MNSHLWLITAETNLHVGNENSSNYGIIDKAVQRDPLTTLPCINSSSLKGAINEFFTNKKKIDSETRVNIFGSDKRGENKKQQKGEVIFLTHIFCSFRFKMTTVCIIMRRSVRLWSCFFREIRC